MESQVDVSSKNYVYRFYIPVDDTFTETNYRSLIQSDSIYKILNQFEKRIYISEDYIILNSKIEENELSAFIQLEKAIENYYYTCFEYGKSKIKFAFVTESFYYSKVIHIFNTSFFYCESGKLKFKVVNKNECLFLFFD